MPAKNRDLHGNVPEQCPIALLLIDVINDLEFPGAEQLFPQALKMAQAIAALRERAMQAGIPTIFVNDNFGRWRSDFQAQVRHCLQDNARGRPIVELLRPHESDYFVLKPKHSGFFATALDTLLKYLGAETLILTGLTTNSCVLFTASDAFIRDFRLIVPRDCVASVRSEEHEASLKQIAEVLHGATRPSDEWQFTGAPNFSISYGDSAAG